MFQPGDRVRWESVGDDGFPIVRYGFVGGTNGDHTRVAVMLDGDLKGDTVVDLDQLEPVTITNIELRLEGADLLSDASMRQGIVNLWTAEADQAGLEVRSLEYLGPQVWGTSTRACARRFPRLPYCRTWRNGSRPCAVTWTMAPGRSATLNCSTGKPWTTATG